MIVAVLNLLKKKNGKKPVVSRGRALFCGDVTEYIWAKSRVARELIAWAAEEESRAKASVLIRIAEKFEFEANSDADYKIAGNARAAHYGEYRDLLKREMEVRE